MLLLVMEMLEQSLALGRLDLLDEHLVHLHHHHWMDIVPSAKEHKMVMDKK